jgi:ABC-type nitrate/sulfonate/bicarbonate transport system substrate-binding protein
MTKSNLSEIWYTRCPVPTPVGLADQLGWLSEAFANEGIALKSIIDSPNRDIRQSHFNHTLDWSFRHGGNIPPIRARSEGRKTRLVGITWTDEYQAILTLPGTGIKSIKDLVGRRFGVERRPDGIVDFQRAISIKGLKSALSLEGFSTKDVEIVEVERKDSVLDSHDDPALFGLRRRQSHFAEVAALIKGEVDAIYLKGTPAIQIANFIGAVEISAFGFHPDPLIRVNSGTPRLLTVDELLAEERPDLVSVLLDTIHRASAWAEAHPDETRRFVARESSASEEQVLASNGPDLHRHLGIGLEPDHIAAVGAYKDFLLEAGFLAADFDVNAWVDRRPLDATLQRHAA